MVNILNFNMDFFAEIRHDQSVRKKKSEQCANDIYLVNVREFQQKSQKNNMNYDKNNE